MGIDKSNIFIGDIGNSISISYDGIKKQKDIPAGDTYIDSIAISDVANVVINDRKRLSRDGIIIVVATVDSQTGYIISGPDIVSRGFVFVKDNAELMNAARDLACRVFDEHYDNRRHDWSTVKSKLREEISHLMYEKTRRSPMILPIIMDV